MRGFIFRFLSVDEDEEVWDLEVGTRTLAKRYWVAFG